MPDPETGEPINVSHVIPRSRADLERRHPCLQRTAEFTVGLMGRTPDYMNVTYAGFAGARRRMGRPTATIEGRRTSSPSRSSWLAMTSRSPTRSFIPPSTRRRGDVPGPGNDVALHKVADTAHGIVVRGARVLATLAPFADELAVYPGRTPAGGRRRLRPVVLAFPWARPASPSSAVTAARPRRNLFDHPLSSRFDEQDAFVIFDDVEVPRERLFIDADPTSTTGVMTTGW